MAQREAGGIGGRAFAEVRLGPAFDRHVGRSDHLAAGKRA